LYAKAANVEDISIAYCPERVLPGKIMTELISNDRIIGGINEESSRKVMKFYETFVNGNVLACSAKTAEMCKLAENSFRDVNIAFANELSMICDTHDIDPWELIRLANHHPRVNILQPGTGVGGHCIAVDPWFIVSGDPENARIIEKARQVNDLKPDWVVSKIAKQVKALVEQGIKHPVIACLGLAFKPDIEDLRESPAVAVVKDLVDMGHNIVVVEPNITEHDFFRLSTFDDALAADLVVVLVNHTIFSSSGNRERLLEANVLDFCGLLAHDRALS
jgi:UDP-N-acetyl-D-mannosaminuronic acid dehydrogenase